MAALDTLDKPRLMPRAKTRPKTKRAERGYFVTYFMLPFLT